MIDNQPHNGQEFTTTPEAQNSTEIVLPSREKLFTVAKADPTERGALISLAETDIIHEL